MIRERNAKGQIVRRKSGEIYEGCGVWYDKKGYACICVGGKDIKLHRYIWERTNGKIPKGMQLHHKDFNKRNYDPSNLVLVNQPDHFRIHAGWIKTDDKWTHKPCNGCGRTLPLTEFYSRKGYTPTAKCKKCHLVFSKEYTNRPEIKEKIKISKKEWYEKNKLPRSLFWPGRI
jgi:hypothetical protein